MFCNYKTSRLKIHKDNRYNWAPSHPHTPRDTKILSTMSLPSVQQPLLKQILWQGPDYLSRQSTPSYRSFYSNTECLLPCCHIIPVSVLNMSVFTCAPLKPGTEMNTTVWNNHSTHSGYYVSINRAQITLCIHMNMYHHSNPTLFFTLPAVKLHHNHLQ